MRSHGRCCTDRKARTEHEANHSNSRDRESDRVKRHGDAGSHVALDPVLGRARKRVRSCKPNDPRNEPGQLTNRPQRVAGHPRAADRNRQRGRHEPGDARKRDAGAVGSDEQQRKGADATDKQ